MFDNWRQLIPYKSYNKFGNIVLTLFFLTSITLIVVISVNEKTSLLCNPKKSVAADISQKAFVQASCSLKYEKKFNSPIPLRGLVVLNFGVVLVVCIVYAGIVKSRVEGFDKPEPTNDIELQPLERGSQPDRGIETRTGRIPVCYIYILHLFICIIALVLFAVLVFYSISFPPTFFCPWSPGSSTTNTVTSSPNQPLNYSTVYCINQVASRNIILATVVWIVDIFFALFASLEAIYLLWCLARYKDFHNDFEFCCVHLLRNRRAFRTILRMCKKKLINSKAFEIDVLPFGKKRSLAEIYVKLIIQEDRYHWKLSAEMGRHEIYRIHLQVPKNTILEVEDMFFSIGLVSTKQIHKVLVIGRPGIGKSVLTKKILYQWATSKNDFYDGKVAILLKFRTFNSDELKKVTFKKMLMCGEFLTASGDFQTFYKYVRAYPERVILIFDGLDELKVDDIGLQEDFPDNYNSPMPVIVLFSKLVTGKFLPGATVITTTRPVAWDSRYVNSSINQFERTFEILGFTEEIMKDYVTNFFGDKSDRSEKVWKFIQGSQELLSLCYIPVSCLIACYALDKYIDDDQDGTSEKRLPRTITELYQTAIRVILWHHHTKCKDTNPKPRGYTRSDDMFSETINCSLKELREIAYDGMRERSLIFRLLSHYRQTNIPSCGLLTSIADEDDSDPQYCFLHLTLQEFLAASKLVDQTKGPEDVRKNLSDHINEAHWHLVIQFYAGLLGDKFKREKSYSVREISESFTEWIPRRMSSEMNDECRRNTCLAIKCIYELQEEDIMRLAAGKIHEWEEDKCIVKSWFNEHLDIVAFMRFLVYVRTLVRLDLSCINGTDRLCLELSTFLLKRGRKISENYEKLTVLNLNGCCVGLANGLKRVCDALISENCKLIDLNLSENFLKIDDVEHLGNALQNEHCKLTNLNLFHNNMNVKGTERLINALQNEHCKLTNLNLSKNGIGSEGAQLLSNALQNEHCKLTNLNISRNKMDSEGAKHISNALQNKYCTLAILDLSENHIKEEGAQLLSKALQNEHCKLSELYLSRNSMGNVGVQHLSNALQNEHCKLTNLNLSRNKINNEGARHLSNALQKKYCTLAILDLSENHIKEEGAQHLSNALQSEHCKLSDLSLSWNSIENVGAEHLSNALQNEHCKLTNLNLSRTEIDSEGAKHFSNALQNKYCALAFLDLSENYIKEEGAQHLCNALEYEHGKLTNLDLSYNFICSEGAQH